MLKITSKSKYNIYIGSGILRELGKTLREDSLIKEDSQCKVIVVSDEKVFGIYGKETMKSIEEAGIGKGKIFSYTFKPGEESKSLEEYSKLLEFLAEKSIGRNDVLVALGGGVTGDLAGFGAATFKRGMKLVHVPTSLVAQVDSSIGGKTAINLLKGKNLVGTFYNPDLVFVDVNTLQSLGQDETAQGMAEVIKYGIIKKGKVLEMAANYQQNTLQLVAECIKIKNDIVDEDPLDEGQRQILNLGHTVGHALESLSGYEISHGQGVSIGMCTMARYMISKGDFGKENYDKLVSLLKQYGLPTASELSPQEVFGRIVNDKKIKGEEITLVLPKDIGNCTLQRVKLEEVKEVLKHLQEQ